MTYLIHDSVFFYSTLVLFWKHGKYNICINVILVYMDVTICVYFLKLC